MRRFTISMILGCLLAATPLQADVITIGLRRALADSLYCALAGCTMTGALTASSGGVVFNGSVLLTQGANVVALANLANGQTLRIGNTFDSNASPTNAEYGSLRWAANAFIVGAEKTGTGTVRETQITGNGIRMLSNNGAAAWLFNTHMVPITTNASDIGSTASVVRTLYVSSIQGSLTKTLPETTATGFVTITVPNSGGCAGKAVYTVFAADATNTQLVSGELFFSAAATSAGTVTAAAISDQHVLNPVTSGTLTNTMTATNAANATTLLANATSSLTQTTLEIRYRIELQGGNCTVTGL